MSATALEHRVSPDTPQITAVLADRAGVLAGPELSGVVVNVADELRRRGVRRGQRVLLKGENAVEYVVTLLALMHLDTSIVIVDSQQTAAETETLVRRTRSTWLVTPEETAMAGVTSLGYADVVRAARANPAPGRTVRLADWFRRPDAAVLWSSGTTGPAKGVVKPGWAIADNTARTGAVMGYRPDDVMVPWLPFSHQYGLSLVLLWWQTGCSLVVTDYRRLTQAMADAVRFQATVVDATPSTYHSLVNILRRRPDLREPLRTVRVWGVGGAPLPAPLARDFREIVGAPLLDGYGLTEAGNVALATPENPVGCGRPLPGVELRVLDAHGNPVAPGELGEVVLRSPGLMAGYLDDNGEVVPLQAGEWYRTNDLARLDADGNLHVVGRRNAVHRLGYTLYPQSIERKAEECGRPVAVVPIEDERRGVALAFFVADPDGNDAAYWRRRISSLLPAYEQPNVVRVVDQFPLNRNGKVDTAALRQMLTRR
ncbi:MAG TPA: fatty acid--CoA ligase family protein [Micromonospora sp.]